MIVVLLNQGKEVFPQDFESHHGVAAIQGAVHKLVEHLEVVSVVSRGLVMRILSNLFDLLFPLWIFEVCSNIKQDFLFFHRTVGVLLS